MAAHSVAGDSKTTMTTATKAAFVMLPLSCWLFVMWSMASLDLPVAVSFNWVPALGVDLSFYLDGLSILMLLMITGVGTAVFV